MKFRAIFAASAFVLTSAAFAQQQNATAGVASSQSAQLQITQPTEAPGLQLSRGTYSIHVADRLQDRIIVQVHKVGSKEGASLLAYPNPGLRGGSFTGPITFASGLKGKPTLRGYAFAGGPVVEFVYPKSDAVTLAKANAVRVMAVDPASEGRVSLPNLTQTDMSEVTLWMLTPTPVDPSTAQPGIQAARYQAPAAPQPAPVTQGSVSEPPTLSASSAEVSQAPSSAPAHVYHATPKASASAPVEVASNTHAPRLRPNVKQLPHTASSLPLISLVGILSFLVAAALGMRRRFAGLRA